VIVSCPVAQKTHFSTTLVAISFDEIVNFFVLKYFLGFGMGTKSGEKDGGSVFSQSY
jgi:hypothetical protein